MQKPEFRSTETHSAPQRGIHSRIFALTVPAVIASVTTPLLGFVDTAVTGHMGGGGVYLAAIALGSNAFNLLYWLFGFIRMGTSGMAAQAHGAGNSHEAARVLARSLVIALGAALLLIALYQPLTGLYQSVMQPTEDVWRQTSSYLMVLVAGIPAVMATTALTGWFIGMQLARKAMWMSITVDIVNVIASLTLVYVFDMKVKGVAVGTLTAQWAGCIAGIVMLRHHVTFAKISLRELFRHNEMKRFFTVNFHIFLRTLCMIGVTLWFTRTSSMQGTVMLAANAVLLQLFMLLSYFTDGVAYAAEALVGHAVGAHDLLGYRRALKALATWGIGVALFFTAFYVIAGNDIVRLLTDEPEVRATAEKFLVWAAMLPLAGIISFIGDGVCIGATRTLTMLMSVAVASLAFFALIALQLPHMGNTGLWLAFTVYLLIRSLYMLAAVTRFRP